MKVAITIPVDERWEKNIPHDSRSEEIYKWLEEYDFKHGSDFFCWKSGGDGDNGEWLMFELDEFFAAKDKENEKCQPA